MVLPVLYLALGARLKKQELLSQDALRRSPLDHRLVDRSWRRLTKR
jgi:hypothetical protein